MNTERRNMANNILQSFNLSALIFWRPDELVLMLGYMPLWGISFLVYTADNEPVLFVPELEPEDILPTGIAIKTFPWGNIGFSNPWNILYDEIKKVLKQKHLTNKPVSFIKSIGGTAPSRMSGEQPPLPADLTKSLSTLNDAGFKDTKGAILGLYQFKTDADIAGIKVAHHVASIAVDTFYKSANPGISESSLAAKIEYAVQETIGQKNIGYARAWPMIQSGINTASGGKYNRTTGKIIAKGDWVLLEMGICVNGYWADITRTTITDQVTDLQWDIFNTVSNAQQSAIDMLRPGVVMCEVDAKARKCIAAAGYSHYFNHPLGHQVGFRYHDPGVGLSPDCIEVLQEGMILTVEPGIYGVDLNGGARVEDNVLITANGCEVLSNYPRGLKSN